MVNPQTKGTLMILLSAIFFGLMPFFALKTYAEGFSVDNLLLYRYSFAFILIGLFCLIRKITLTINQKQFLLILFLAFVGTMLTTYTLFLSYRYISSGLASTLHFVYPIVTISFAAIIYKERFTVRKTTALLLSVTGIALLSVGTESNINLTGFVWAIVSGFLYAIYILGMASEELKKLPPLTIAFWIFGITTLLFFAKSLLTNQLNTHFTPTSLFYTLNLAVWSTFFAVVLFYKGMKYTGPGTASLLSTLEPLTGVFVGIFVFNEKMDVKSSLAILLILTSVLIVVQIKKKRQHHLIQKLRHKVLKRA